MKTAIKTILIAVATGCSAATCSGVASADTVTVPVGQQGADHAGMTVPHGGQTEAAVEQHYGQPQHRSAPVGNPPITRWDYPAFTVYFEYNKVIHSVIHPDRAERHPS